MEPSMIPTGFLILAKALPWIAVCAIVAAVSALAIESFLTTLHS